VKNEKDDRMFGIVSSEIPMLDHQRKKIREDLEARGLGQVIVLDNGMIFTPWEAFRGKDMQHAAPVAVTDERAFGFVGVLQRLCAGGASAVAIVIFLALFDGPSVVWMYQLAALAPAGIGAWYERRNFKLHGMFANIFDVVMWTFGAALGALLAWMFHHAK
jgi:hypothetical protein